MIERSSPPYVLGIDAGTEAIKAGIFDLRGTPVASASAAYPTDFPRAGWAEQDPNEWWEALVRAVRGCLARAAIDSTQIVGISADATTCTLVPMRRDGAELRRALLWMDVRASEQAARIFATGHAALRYCPAGVNAEWMLPKAMWLKEHEPDIYDQTDVLLEYADWIAYRLTGRFTLNINTATHRWFYHRPSGGWPADLFAQVGLDDLLDKFPPDVLPVGEPIGALTAQPADVLGLPAGIPVATGGGDAFIGMLGQRVIDPGDLGVIMGSSNVLCGISDRAIHAPGVFGSFPSALLPGLHSVEGGQVSTGSILAWFTRHFARDLVAQTEANGGSVYQLLDAEAAQVPIGSNGLILLDYFQGNRTPHTDSLARGVLWGLSLQSTRAAVFRAIMEGIAYGMYDIVETFRNQGFVVERIVASGGATRSPLFMQIYADVLNLPVYVTTNPEASLLGSAAVAAVGGGAHPDLAAASQQMVTLGTCYEPKSDRHEQYRFFVDKYQRTYPQMKALMQEMTQVLSNSR